MIAAGWTEARSAPTRIADNKLTLNGGWDQDMLALELGELEVLGFDVDLVGFPEDDELFGIICSVGIDLMVPETIEARLERAEPIEPRKCPALG